jgi:murein DD-endopeptidase MepM/ murein hydrolase activator NlpD
MSDNWLLNVGDKDPAGGPFHCRGAEWLLAGHNVFQTSWYDGAIDGIFGPQAAEAARRAKFELGYTTASVKPTFGTLLKDYLTGKKKRPPAMIARAKTRAKKFIWPTNPKGKVIGFPGIGTHSFKFPPNNWESDNAWDIAVPSGSRALAVAAGTIGPAFGPLPDQDPRFAGIRLHLVTADNEVYYAHLKSTFPGIGPGVKVRQGDILGATGEANSVEHLHIAFQRLIPLAQI